MLEFLYEYHIVIFNICFCISLHTAYEITLVHTPDGGFWLPSPLWVYMHYVKKGQIKTTEPGGGGGGGGN